MAALIGSSHDPDGIRMSAIRLWFRRLRSSRPLQAVAVLGSLVFVGIIVGTVLLAQELRDRETGEARRNLMNLNAVLTEATGRALESVDLVLRSIVEDLKGDGIETLEDYRRLQSGKATHDALKAKTAGLPQLDALSLVGSDGRLINFSRAFPIPEIEISDREHFKSLRDTAVQEPMLSELLTNRGSNEATVYVARRVRATSGAFLGIVYAALDLSYFRDFYGSLDLGRDSSISIWRMDGLLLVRHPPFAGEGRPFSNPALRDVTATSPPLSYETQEGIDGKARFVTRRVVPDFPAVVVATRTVAEALAEWRRLSIVFGVAGALVSAAVVALMIAVAQQFLSYEEVARAVEEKTAAVQGRAQAEALLRQSQKLEVMGQLTSGVAHDFNNLLTVVIGNLDLLGRRLPADQAALRRYVDGAKGGADRAASLTQRLLAFSRRQSLEPQTLDANDLIAGMRDLMRQTLGENMILDLDLEPGLAPVFADPSQLEAALLNLVVNARDAMPGGGTVSIETRHEAETRSSHGRISGPTGTIRITVTDTGLGMSPEVLRRAFEPFFTTKAPGVGTGLGLAQVYGFAKQSAGDVAIESAEGAGTRISLSLPVAERSKPPIVVAPARPTTRAMASARDVVLVVDDHPDVRRTSVEALENEGYSVREAEDAATALRIIETETVTILLTDIGLPGRDGRELAEAARRLRPGIGVLLMTGHGTDGTRRGGRQEADLPILLKPFTSAAMTARIAEVLATARASTGSPLREPS